MIACDLIDLYFWIKRTQKQLSESSTPLSCLVLPLRRGEKHHVTLINTCWSHFSLYFPLLPLLLNHIPWVEVGELCMAGMEVRKGVGSIAPVLPVTPLIARTSILTESLSVNKWQRCVCVGGQHPPAVVWVFTSAPCSCTEEARVKKNK